MYGVTFNDMHSLNDLGMYLKKKVVHPPEVQTYFVEVPQRDGKIDLTESLTGQVKYNNRTIELEFTLIDDFINYQSRFSEIENILHGKQMKIIFDDDLSYYYIGRLTFEQTEVSKRLGVITIKADCEPYKIDVSSSNEDWVWDSFDFETGIINELANIVVEGTKEVSIIASARMTYPTIVTDENISVEFDGVSYDLIKGSNTMYEILLPKGENKLIFKGNATITIKYRNGSL